MAKFNLNAYTSADGLGFPLNFRRGNPNPLDNSSVWASLTAAQNYAKTDPVAYVGQVLTVLDVVDGTANAATVYCIQNEAGDLARVGTVTLGDDTTIIKNEDNTLSIKGYADAAEGAQLVKTADGLAWIVPSTTTVEGLQTAVAALQETVGDSTKGLVKQVADNKAAIATLNADSTTEGSVAYQIAQIVAGADASFDTLKEIADWIGTHTTDAATMNSQINTNKTDIASLKELVGSEAVATQIANAIDAALKSGETDKYALASDLTTLAGRVTTAEQDIDALETKVGTTTVAEQIAAALKGEGDEDKYALKKHTHIIDDVTGLQDALNLKATDAGLKALEAVVDGKADKATDLAGYGITDAYTKTAADEAVATKIGEVGEKTVKAYVDDAIAAKSTADGTTYATKTEVTEAIAGAGHAAQADLEAHTGDTTVHITADERTQWNAAEKNKIESITSASNTITVVTGENRSVDISLNWGTFGEG